MKILLAIFVFIIAALSLPAEEINWHSMGDLVENVNKIETRIFVYADFHNDYLGGLFNEGVLTDSRIIKTLNQDYYCVRIYSREDTSNYVLYGKTYKYDGFSHQLMFAMLGYIAVIPVQIILDQRECIIQGGDSLNVVYENGSYITAENFYTQLQTYRVNKDPALPPGK